MQKDSGDLGEADDTEEEVDCGEAVRGDQYDVLFLLGAMVGAMEGRGTSSKMSNEVGAGFRDLQVVLGLDYEAPAGPDDAGAGQGKVLG